MSDLERMGAVWEKEVGRAEEDAFDIKKNFEFLENSIQDISYKSALYNVREVQFTEDEYPICLKDHILLNRTHYKENTYCLDSRDCFYKKIDNDTKRQLCTFYEKNKE